MAISRFVLKTLPGIDRPAIAGQLPTRKAWSTVLDLGANVNCSPEQLVQFARDGHVRWSATMDGIERAVGRPLNVGEEEIKGNDVVEADRRAAARIGPQFLRQRRRRRHLSRARPMSSSATASSATWSLKASEGLAVMLYEMLKTEFTRNVLSKLAALLAYPLLMRVQAPRGSPPLQRRDARSASWVSSSRATAAPMRLPSSTRCARPTRKPRTASSTRSRSAWRRWPQLTSEARSSAEADGSGNA